VSSRVCYAPHTILQDPPSPRLCRVSDISHKSPSDSEDAGPQEFVFITRVCPEGGKRGGGVACRKVRCWFDFVLQEKPQGGTEELQTFSTTTFISDTVVAPHFLICCFQPLNRFLRIQFSKWTSNRGATLSYCPQLVARPSPPRTVLRIW